MKKVFILSAVVAASLIATKSYSQVYVDAHVGFRVPGARVYVSSCPAYVEPAPVVYQTAPVYNDGGYGYYNYPAWNGHYRDQCYYEHYRPYFEREHSEYFHRDRYDHDRYDHDRYDHERFDHERDEHRDYGHRDRW